MRISDATPIPTPDGTEEVPVAVVGDGAAYRVTTGAIAAMGGGHVVSASASQSQAGATQLDYGMSFILPAAGNSYTVQLPPALAGRMVSVSPQQGGANQTILFAKNRTTDTIDNQINSTAWDVWTTVGMWTTFICDVDGHWVSNAQVD